MTIVEREWENMEIIATSILNENNKIMCKLGKKNKKCMHNCYYNHSQS